MAKHTLLIGDKVYKTKKSALDYYKSILNKYDFNSDLDDADFEDILSLINYSPTKVENVENQNSEIEDMVINNVYVDSHPMYKRTKCFYIEFGEEVWLFSYILAINGDMSDEKKFYVACRNSIQNYINEFKRNIFKQEKPKCAITSKDLTFQECHIDHKPPMTFSVIVQTFIKANNIKIYDEEIDYINQIWQFNNNKIKSKFINYHNDLAILRIISSKENLKGSKNGRIKPTKNDHNIKKYIEQQVQLDFGQRLAS